MKVTISCPHGSYDANMRIRCSVSGSLCAHQYWCGCEGRSKLRDTAADCPGRDRQEKQKKP